MKLTKKVANRVVFRFRVLHSMFVFFPCLSIGLGYEPYYNSDICIIQLALFSFVADLTITYRKYN